MLTFSSFTGINNVIPSKRLGPKDLTEAMNVNIGLSGEVSRRRGYAKIDDDCHKNLWNGAGFQLATIGSELVAFDGSGRRVQHPNLGSSRVWYCDLPDGRIAFSNGNICGLTDGKSATMWGVPTPDSVGIPARVAGDLFPGDYRYLVTHVRLSDGLEGPPAFGGEITLSDGGLLLTDLPQLDGHATNIYLSGRDGDECFLAGTSTGSAFSYLGSNDALVLPCRTLNEVPAPAGRLLAFWRGRALVARGKVLYASQPHRWEAFNLLRDFKQFASPITLVGPVAGGIYVGTEDELLFLAGVQFDALTMQPVCTGRVVLGSGCVMPNGNSRLGENITQVSEMVCIVGGNIVLCSQDGNATRVEAYRTDTEEVTSMFRVEDGILQYVAVGQ